MLGGIRQGPLCAGGQLRRHGGRLQRGRHLRLLGSHWGRLMRHFLLLPLSVRGLARGMGMPAIQRALVTPSCLSHRLPPGSLPARLTAVALAPIAPAAQEELAQALRSATHHISQCFHAPPGAWPASGAAPRSALPPSHRPAHLALPGRASRQAFQVQLEGLPFFRGTRSGNFSGPQLAHNFSVSPGPPHTAPLPRAVLLTSQALPLRGDDDGGDLEFRSSNDRKHALPEDHQHMCPARADRGAPKWLHGGAGR